MPSRYFERLKLDVSNIITTSPANPLKVSDIRLNQLYRVTSDPNMIDDTGRDKILEMTTRVNLRDPKWESLLPEGFDPYEWNGGLKNRLKELPPDWCWKNVVANKKIPADAVHGVGKFAVRYRNFILKQQGIKLPDKFVQDLGQIAGRYSDQSEGSILRFVNEFDWQHGDFGDSGSCFWGGREEARVILADQGSWAVQLFRPESIDLEATPDGLARAWIVPNYPFKGVMTMFNGYGKNMGEPSRVIARILANLVGMAAYGEIKLDNHDTTEGTMYINSGRGFVIGDLEGRKLNTHYDLQWPEKIIGRCCHCEENVFEHEDSSSVGDRLYCSSCYDNYTTYDEIAHETFDPSFDGEHILWRKNSRGDWTEYVVSDDTYDECGYMCEACQDDVHRDNMNHVETSGTWYCDECYHEHVSVCDECGADHENEDMELVDDDKNLCPVCAEDWHEEQSLIEEEGEDVDESVYNLPLSLPDPETF